MSVLSVLGVPSGLQISFGAERILFFSLSAFEYEAKPSDPDLYADEVVLSQVMKWQGNGSSISRNPYLTSLWII